MRSTRRPLSVPIRAASRPRTNSSVRSPIRSRSGSARWSMRIWRKPRRACRPCSPAAAGDHGPVDRQPDAAEHPGAVPLIVAEAGARAGWPAPGHHTLTPPHALGRTRRERFPPGRHGLCRSRPDPHPPGHRIRRFRPDHPSHAPRRPGWPQGLSGPCRGAARQPTAVDDPCRRGRRRSQRAAARPARPASSIWRNSSPSIPRKC